MIYGMSIPIKNAIKILMHVGHKKTRKRFMVIKTMQKLIQKVNS